jgi:hypothetical protein
MEQPWFQLSPPEAVSDIVETLDRKRVKVCAHHRVMKSASEEGRPRNLLVQDYR